MKYSAVIIAATLALGAVSTGWASECFESPEAVRAQKPGAYPKVTHYMKGHRLEECWYPRGEHFEHADRSETPKKHKTRVAAVPPPPPAPVVTPKPIVQPPVPTMIVITPTPPPVVAPVLPSEILPDSQRIASAHAGFPTRNLTPEERRFEQLFALYVQLHEGLRGKAIRLAATLPKLDSNP